MRKVLGGNIDYILDEVSLPQGLQAQQVWWAYHDIPFRKLSTRAQVSSGGLRLILG